MRRLTLLAILTLLLLPGTNAFAQSTARSTQRTAEAALGSTNLSQHEEVLHALAQIRAHLDEAPVAPVVAKPVDKRESTFPGDSATTGGISGYVIIDANDSGGSASDSAWVLAVATDVTGNPTAWQSTSVNADGRYVFAALQAGAYILMAGASGAQPLFFRQARTIADAEPVGVVPGIMLEGFDFFLETTPSGSGAISGTVRSAADGLPIGGASVFVYRVGSPYVAMSVPTDSGGAYLFDNLYSGQYIVQAYAPGFFARFYDDAPTADLATPVVVTDDTTSDGIDFSLSRSGSIAGRVTDQDGNPIERADVFVYSSASPGPDSLNGSSPCATPTNADGETDGSGLTPGENFVQVQAFNRWFTVSEWYDDAAPVADASTVRVNEGEETTDIDFQLDLSVDLGRITGQVAFANGDPVANAFLHAEPFSDATGDSLEYYVYAFAETDADGHYTFDDIPTGDYRVSLQYWGNAYYPTMWYDGVFGREEATPVVVATGETTDGIDFVLPRADGVIEGTITDPNGKPVVNANVFASPGENFYPGIPGSGGQYAYAVSDENGEYRIAGLIDDEYYVNASACLFWQCVERWWPDGASFPDAQPVVVSGGQSDPAAVDIMLPLVQGTATLSGVVQHIDGRALAGAWVTVALTSEAHGSPGGDPVGEPNTDPFTPGDSLIWITELQTTTDSSGAFAFRNIPAGDYIANASFWEAAGFAIQWYDGVDFANDATVIRLADGDTREDIDFVLEPKPTYGTLAGRVWMDGPVVSPPDSVGAPVSRAYVEVSPFYWDYAAWLIDPVPYFAVTGSDGAFVLDGLPNGRYYVNVYAQGARILDPTDDSRYLVEITGGETTFIDVALARVDEGQGAIAGFVSASDGQALDIAVVIAIPDDDPNRTYTAISEPDGRYELTGLSPGEYVLWSFAPYHATVYYDNVYDPSEATRIEVNEGKVTGIDFSLSPIYYLFDDERPIAENTSYVFGQVTDDDGVPLGQALVYVLDDAGQVIRSTRTHADGMYEIAGLMPGNDIRIKATHAGYVSRYHDGADAFDASAAAVLGSGRFEINFSLSPGVSTGRDGHGTDLPSGIVLSGNYPNPFERETQIAFTLSAPMDVAVTVYDALGRRVTELYSGALSAGEHQLPWDASTATGQTVTSGVYFYRVTAGRSAQTGRMLVVR